MAQRSGPYKDENDETKYEPVANNSRSSTESEGVDVDSLEHESKTALLRSLRICRLLLTVLILVLIFIIPYTTYMFIKLSNQPPSKRHGLGTDRSHFVPLGMENLDRNIVQSTNSGEKRWRTIQTNHKHRCRWTAPLESIWRERSLVREPR